MNWPWESGFWSFPWTLWYKVFCRFYLTSGDTAVFCWPKIPFQTIVTLSIKLSIQHIFRSINLSILFFCSIYHSIYLRKSFYLSIYIPEIYIYIWHHLSSWKIFLSINLSIYLSYESFYLSIYLSKFFAIYWTIFLAVLSIYQAEKSFYLSIYLSYTFFYLPSIYLSYNSFYLSIYLSFYIHRRI